MYVVMVALKKTLYTILTHIKFRQKNGGANERDLKNWMIHDPEYDIEGMIRDLENDYKGESFNVPSNVQLHVHNVLTRIAKQIAYGSGETIDIAQHVKGELN